MLVNVSLRRERCGLLGIAGALATLVAGCGGGEAVVARVGGHAITKAALAHWMAAMAPEHVVPDPPRYTACIAHQRDLAPEVGVSELREECERQEQALEQQALGFLISSRWLLSEAATRGVEVPAREVRSLLRRKLAFLGHDYSRADAELMVRAEVAAAGIQRSLSAGEPRLARARIAAYYRRHVGSYERPERRYFDVVEHLASRAAARKAMSEVAAGRSLASLGAIHEWLARMDLAGVAPENRRIRIDIFAARPHVLVGPERLTMSYAIFEVTKVVPRVVRSLAQARSAIEQRLAREQQRRTLARFVAGWRARWTARTDCRPGYVVPKCRQYAGPRRAEDPFALR